MSEPTRRWLAWWQVYTAVFRLVNRLPIAEWRKEAFSYRLDIWGMNHFGRSQRERDAMTIAELERQLADERYNLAVMRGFVRSDAEVIARLREHLDNEDHLHTIARNRVAELEGIVDELCETNERLRDRGCVILDTHGLEVLPHD